MNPKQRRAAGNTVDLYKGEARGSLPESYETAGKLEAVRRLFEARLSRVDAAVAAKTR